MEGIQSKKLDYSNLSLSHCYADYPDEDMMESVKRCAFWFEGVLLVFVGLFGIIGNTVSIIVLSKANMKNSFNHLLIALALFDTIFITLCILDFSLARVFEWPCEWKSEIYALLFPKGIYPFNSITFCCSTFLIIVIAYERFMAISDPLHHRYRNVTITKDVRVLKYILFVLIFSFLINSPKFFEYEVNLRTPVFEKGEVWNNMRTRTFQAGPIWNITETNNNQNEIETEINALIEKNEIETKITFKTTDLMSNPHYIMFYTNIFLILITGVFPVTLLIYFNVKIYLGIKGRIRSTHSHNRQPVSEINLAIILICIVIVFILCNVPRLSLNIYEFVANSFVQK